jgi:CheY-like chemotaxis protein
MIVDDDREFLEEMTEIFDMCGYEVLPVLDSYNVMAEAKAKHPEVIILDLKMRGLSGFEVAKMLRNDPSTSSISLIAITGYFKESSYMPKIVKYGFNKCLIKPFHPLEAINAVESA